MSNITISGQSAVAVAAEWIAAQPPGVTVPTIRAQFPLSAKEACEAAALAVAIRRNHGGHHV